MNEKIKIRVEEQEDYEIVENLTRDSFWNVYRPKTCIINLIG